MIRLGILLMIGLALALAGGCTSGPAPATVMPTAQPAPTAAPTAGPTPTPAGPVRLTYWEEDSDAAGVLLDELAAAFQEANPDVVVTRVHYGYDDLRSEFRNQAFAGRAPELVRAPGEFAGPFGELGIVQPVQSIFASDFLQQYLPGSLAGVTLKGRVLALPDNFGNHLVLLYNKALVSVVPSNTDDWLVQLKTLTDPAVPRYGLVYSLDEAYWLIPWLSGFGSWPLDAAQRVSLDTLEMVETLRFVQDLRFRDQVVPQQADYTASFELFGQGRAAYIIDGMWNFDRYQGLGIDFGVAPFPKVSATGLAPASMATGRYWFISKEVGGLTLDAAARFVEFMTSSDAQEQWLAQVNRLPSHRDTVTGWIAAGDPLLAGVLEGLRVARGLPPALEMACAWQGINAHLGAVVSAAENPEDAAPAMQAEAEICVEDMGGYVTPEP